MRVRAAAWRAFPILAALCGVGAAAGPYEDAPQPALAGVLSPELRKSTHHSVEEVHVNGRFYAFRMESDFGSLSVSSLALLRIRVDEAETLAQAVNGFERRDRDLSQELHGQFSIRADNAIDILAQPVSTASDIAGQFADDLNRTLSGGAAEEGAAPAPAYGDPADDDPGIAMHKRNVAAQWGLDAYSSNPEVQAFLATVARARSGGRISAGAPSLILPGARRAGVEDSAIDAEVAARLKTLSVAELRADNTALLAGMQVGPDLAQKFLEDPVYSPRHQTRIAHYLAALDGVRDRAAFLESALDATDESVALAFEEAAMMLVRYQRAVEPLQKLYSGKDMLQAITAGNRLVCVLPVDIIYWSENTDRLFDGVLQRARQAGLSGWEAVVAGDVTPLARQALEQRGFGVRPGFAN